MPSHYLKYKEPVFEGFENFSFKEDNYEIMQKDIRFIENSQTPITQHDVEKVIDVFEKIVLLGESQSKEHLVTRFLEVAPPEYVARIPKATLEAIY